MLGKHNKKSDVKKEKKDKVMLTPAAKEKIEELKLLSVSLAEAKEKAEDYYTQLISLKAEFDNYRKRSGKESSQMASYGKKTVIKEFLPVMDNLGAPERLGVYIGLIGATLINLAYPIFLLVWFLRRRIADEVRTWAAAQPAAQPYAYQPPPRQM